LVSVWLVLSQRSVSQELAHFWAVRQEQLLSPPAASLQALQSLAEEWQGVQGMFALSIFFLCTTISV
jgi:hypothetical protein